MKFLFSLFLLSSSLMTQGTTASHSKPLVTPRKHSQSSTHLAVCKDAFFEKSNQAILPKGVLRLFDNELSKLTINSSAKTARSKVDANSFPQGKATAKDIKQTLGTPVSQQTNDDRQSAYSFNATSGTDALFGVDPNGHIFATTGAIVVYIFDPNGILINTHAYIVAP